jgi:hypothetical protein
LKNLITLNHAKLNPALYMPLVVSMLLARNELACSSFIGIARKYGDRAADFFPARGDATADTAGM